MGGRRRRPLLSPLSQRARHARAAHEARPDDLLRVVYHVAPQLEVKPVAAEPRVLGAALVALQN